MVFILNKTQRMKQGLVIMEERQVIIVGKIESHAMDIIALKAKFWHGRGAIEITIRPPKLTQQTPNMCSHGKELK